MNLKFSYVDIKENNILAMKPIYPNISLSFIIQEVKFIRKFQDSKLY